MVPIKRFEVPISKFFSENFDKVRIFTEGK
jgi:hypothetical protein